MRFLFDFIGWKRIVALLVAVVLLSISDLVGIAVIFPYLKILAEPTIIVSNKYLKSIYDDFGFHSTTQFSYALSSCLLVMFTVKSGLTLLLTKFQIKSLAELAHKLTSVMFNLLMQARYDYFVQRSASEVMGMNYAYSAQVVVCFQAWLGMINELIFFIFVFAASLYFQPLATCLVAAGIGMIVGILYVLVIKRIVRYGREQGRIDAARHRWTFATVSSIKDMKIMGLGNMFYQRTEELSAQTKEIAWRNNLAGTLPRISVEYIIIVAFVVAAVVVMQAGLSMQQMLPLLGLMALAALRVMPALGRFTANYSTFRYSKNYLDKLEEFHRTLTASGQHVRPMPTKFERGLEIKHLSFSHGSKQILKDLSMRIPKGASIGIVGASGSGKSTLLDVVTGLQEKAAGQFLLDEKEVDPYATDAIRQHIGYVPQQIALIDESIAFNISFSHHYDVKKIESVLKIANLDRFVATLPLGIETSVGEAGVRLSGGQKQRLGIARALYRDPQILIFDESTSALDNITEKELSREIQSLAGDKTLMIVAHRLTTIMGCDLIYLMDDGRVVASGTHDELMHHCDLYKTMNAPERKFDETGGARTVENEEEKANDTN